MLDIKVLLREKRKSKGLSLREAAKRSGISHSYIDMLEKGAHPNTSAPIKPSPDILRRLATAYNCDYIELMDAAGYVVEDEKERVESALPESELDRVIREAELHFGVSLQDDPVVHKAVRELIHTLAKMKQK